MSLLFNFGLLLIIILLLLVLSMVWPPDSPWSPWWRTSKKTARVACRLARVTSKDIVYELGCGDGTFLAIAAKGFGAKGFGIEIDPLRAFVARLLVRYYGVSDRASIVRGNFFDQDLSKATVVFVYLVPKALARLKPKLLKELKKGTRIVSFRYKIDLPVVREDRRRCLYLFVLS